MCDNKRGAFPSASSDKFLLWELGILSLRSENMFRLDRVVYMYIIEKDLNESYKLMGPIAKIKEFPTKVRVV
jgi:hypothetical protein